MRSIGAFEPDTLYEGDALLLMEQIPDCAVDLIVTDPPFAIDFTAQRLNYNRTGSNVIEGYREIPAGEYREFTRRWIAQAARVLSPAGSMYIFSGWNWLRDILEGIDAAGLTTINHLIWKYQFGVFTKKVRHQSLPHPLCGEKPEEIHLQQARPLSRGRLGDQPRVPGKERKRPRQSSRRNWFRRSSGIPATRVILSSTRSLALARSRLSHSRKAGIF